MGVEITRCIKCEIRPSFKVHTCPIYRVIVMYNIVEICRFHKKCPTESGGRLIKVANFEVCAEKHNEIKWTALQFIPKNTMK